MVYQGNPLLVVELLKTLPTSGGNVNVKKACCAPFVRLKHKHTPTLEELRREKTELTTEIDKLKRSIIKLKKKEKKMKAIFKKLSHVASSMDEGEGS